jgi:hypothetical protein
LGIGRLLISQVEIVNVSGLVLALRQLHCSCVCFVNRLKTPEQLLVSLQLVKRTSDLSGDL